MLQRCCPKILTKSQLDHNVNLSESIDLQYFTKNTCRSGLEENRFYLTVFNDRPREFILCIFFL